MGTVRGPDVIGICLSPLQGEASVWCLLGTGEGVCGGRRHPEGLGGNSKSQSGQGGRRGEGKKGGFRLFGFPKEDESWIKLFEIQMFFSCFVRKESLMGNGMEYVCVLSGRGGVWLTCGYILSP